MAKDIKQFQPMMRGLTAAQCFELSEKHKLTDSQQKKLLIGAGIIIKKQERINHNSEWLKDGGPIQWHPHSPFPQSPSQTQSDDTTKIIRQLVDESTAKSMNEKYKS